MQNSNHINRTDRLIRRLGPTTFAAALNAAGVSREQFPFKASPLGLVSQVLGQAGLNQPAMKTALNKADIYACDIAA